MTASDTQDIPTPVAPSTGERLERAAQKLFATRWYATVSVAEICREAGVSNGIFYRYFRNKEELFRKLLGRILSSIEDALRGVGGSDLHERLDDFVGRLAGYTHANPDLIAIFREGQYRFFDYERSLMDIYRTALATALGRRCGMADYLFALGGVRFASIRRALQGVELDPAELVRITEFGAYPGMRFDAARVFEIEVKPPPIVAAPATRERLLQAGKRLFGEKGYHETAIHEITDAAKLAVGSFYLHFPSKEAFYAELIRLVGHEVRRFISGNLGQGLNELERELQGIWLFSIFLSIDRWCYNVVREAEFVLPAEVKAYYDAFEAGYRRHPESGTPLSRDPVSAARVNFMLGISHYFGLEIVFDNSPGNARALIEEIGLRLSGGFTAARSGAE